MTTTTDRLVATTKTETKPGNCWVLVHLDTDEPLDDDVDVHFASEQRANEWVATCASNYRPQQLTAPCVTVSCSCCGYTYDEDDAGVVHFEGLAEARKLLAKNEGWTVAADGTAKCQPCAAGECDECAGEASRA